MGSITRGPSNSVVYLGQVPFIVAPATCVWNGTTTTWSTPAAPLPVAGVQGLQNHNMAYDSARGLVVFFGGNPFSHGIWDRTFEWNGTVWTESLATRPPGLARHSHAMAYHAQSGKVVVFGGTVPPNTHVADTWTYDGQTWVQAAAGGAGQPSARWGAAMAYDPISREVVLFGGRDAALGEQNDTWTWNGTAWTLKNPVTVPTPRRQHYMTFDVARSRIVMHGGIGAGTVEGITYEWDGANWHQYAAGGIQSTFGPMTYDPSRGKVIELWFGTTIEYSNTASGHIPVTSPLWNWTSVAAGTGPRGIATVGRSNGRRDLAVANHGGNSVTILTNDGTGAFSTGTTIALTAPEPVAVASGNLDTFGTAPANDLVVACEAPTGGVYQVAKIVEAGEATGQTTTYATTLGRKPVHVACANLDGDTRDDIVVACQGETLQGSGIEVIFTGGTHTQIATKSTVRLAAENLDQVAGRDIVGLGQSPDTLDFFANDGSGGFTAAGSIALNTPYSGAAKSLCCGDMDGDGDSDLVVLVPDLFGPNRFMVYRNNGALALTAANVTGGKFTAVGPITTSGSFALDVACGDFEDDTIDAGGIAFTGKSRKDICIVNALGDPTVHDAWNGASFASTLLPASGSNPVACVVADLNNDGCDDLAIANQGSNNVTVSLTVVPSIAETFATGCTGSSGVPVIGSTGTPSAGATAFAVSLASARANALALLAFSAGVTNAPGNACNVFLAAPLVSLYTFTSGAGTSSIAFGIPAGIPKGIDVYLQWAVFDPAGAFLGTLALSGALRLQIGN
jgi:hypothetical protein